MDYGLFYLFEWQYIFFLKREKWKQNFYVFLVHFKNADVGRNF